MQQTKRLLSLLLAWGMLCALFGCATKGQTESKLKERLSSPLEMYLSVERQGEVFSANVTLGEGNTMDRDIEMAFLTPPSVKGLTLCQKNRQLTAEFGGLTVKEEAVRQILLLLSPFSLHSYTESTAYREGKDTVFCYVGEGESITFYCEKEGVPHKIIYTLPGETLTLYPQIKGDTP